MLYLVHGKIEWSQPPKLFHCFSPKFSCFDLPPNSKEKASTTILLYSWICPYLFIFLDVITAAGCKATSVVLAVV